MPKISYIEEGKGEVVLLLHGWGQNKEMMLPIIDELKTKYKCVIVDLPGFGESKFNNEKDLDEYTINLRSFLESENLLPKYIVGHSFGGKVAISYILKYRDLKGLVVIASPLVKPKRSIKYYYNVHKYKLKKKLHLKVDNQGSRDYKDCSKEMKSFFVKIVNTHFNKVLNDINIPTLLIWGDKDDKVPLSKAKQMQRKISNSSLVVEKGGHFAYLENIEFTKLVIQNFLRRNF